jgi:PleD family two-component response regulator
MIYLALSEDIFNKIKILLESQKIKYKRIEDGETLLKQAQKEKPELIILEKDLPLLDGFAVTLLLKSDAKTQDIPVLAICKCNYKEEEFKAKDCGSDELIIYPFKEDEIWEKIYKLIKK